ncbi:MAG: hypothetical protein FJY88_00285 [Candidatus Eisenbacteria bacterium]|nr:hypothetical protein [Candidatus Eisenbacteria bacterium]
MPPQGWSISQTNPLATWRQSSVDPFEGEFCAACPYDDRLGEQEEWLSFAHTLAPDEATLTFAAMGSVYWSTTPHQNYNLLVAINGAVVWDFRSANRGTSWVWEVHRVDVREHIGSTVLVAFGYVGSDGAEGDFDAVSFSDYALPPPPANDDCAGASRLPCGTYSIIGSTALASNDYSPFYPSSCTGYSASGPDLVYFTDLKSGERLSVVMDTVMDWDDSVYLLAECGEGRFTCVAGDDAYPDMSAFEYTAAIAGRYYLVVDGFGGASGEFSISGANGCTPVAVRTVRWSTLKAMFR